VVRMPQFGLSTTSRPYDCSHFPGRVIIRRLTLHRQVYARFRMSPHHAPPFNLQLYYGARRVVPAIVALLCLIRLTQAFVAFPYQGGKHSQVVFVRKPFLLVSNDGLDSQSVDEAIMKSAMAAIQEDKAQRQQKKQEQDSIQDEGPRNLRDFYSVEAAVEEMAEAEERYVQARARRERFLMEAQANFRKLAERADEELQAFVAEEEAAAQDLERRAKEVREVKEEVSVLVKEADELRAGGKGLLASVDLVLALSILVVLDTFYVSYLTYRGSDLVSSSLATEALLGGVLFFKVRLGVTRLESFRACDNCDNVVLEILHNMHQIFFVHSAWHNLQIKQREAAQLDKEKSRPDDGSNERRNLRNGS